MRGPMPSGLAVLMFCAACGRVDFDAARDAATTDGGGDDGNAGPSSLTVTISGDGAVLSDPVGLACVDQCSAPLAGSVTLTAYRGGAHSLAAWTGTTCGAAPTCTLDVVGDVAVTADFSGPLPTDLNLAFATAASYTGDLGGLTGADAICADAATSAGLPGTFTAFISTPFRNAIDPLAGSTGWIRTDGTQMFQQVSDLAAYGQLAPFHRDEQGAALPDDDYVWMGGDVRGIGSGANNCTAFTATAGSGYEWQDNEGVGPGSYTTDLCSNTAHLPCVSHGLTGTLVPFPIGRYIFSTTGGWHGPNVASADALCATQATSAGLPGTYVALLATETQSISDRIGGIAGPWRNPAGVLLTFGDLTTSLRAPLAPLGAAQAGTWLGAYDLVTPATFASSCSDYAFTTGNGAATPTNDDGSDWLGDAADVFCSGVGYEVLCAQTPGS